jgi:hypothetical protein
MRSKICRSGLADFADIEEKLYIGVVRLTTLTLCAIAALFWVWVLCLNITYLDFVACVLLPETSIEHELWHKIIFPSVLLTLTLVLFVLASFRKLPSKVSLYFSLVVLASIPIYYVTLTGLAVSDPTATFCQT